MGDIYCLVDVRISTKDILDVYYLDKFILGLDDLSVSKDEEIYAKAINILTLNKLI